MLSGREAARGGAVDHHQAHQQLSDVVLAGEGHADGRDDRDGGRHDGADTGQDAVTVKNTHGIRATRPATERTAAWTSQSTVPLFLAMPKRNVTPARVMNRSPGNPSEIASDFASSASGLNPPGSSRMPSDERRRDGECAHVDREEGGDQEDPHQYEQRDDGDGSERHGRPLEVRAVSSTPSHAPRIPRCGTVTSVTRQPSMRQASRTSDHSLQRHAARRVRFRTDELDRHPADVVREDPDVPDHRSPLPADPRPHQRARRGAAGDVRPDDRPPRPRLRRARPGGARRARPGLRHDQPGRGLPELRHGRLGGRAGQHALPRGPGAVVRDRPLRDALAGDGRPRSGSRSTWCPATGGTASTRTSSRSGWRPTPATRSRPSAWSTTRPRPASPAGSPRYGPPWTAPVTRRCCSSTPSPRSARSTTATTSGGST